ncbi:DNA repair protein RAD50 [Trichonephila clavata]|uniref:DNA repair protein RAD50 n=1 Tax=Trichonephila clavata TaxID=2740835 RepID=A0A8X6IB70_TRICU|nr:DNA repair protein RAD50 [Trichonephila clavata]
MPTYIAGFGQQRIHITSTIYHCMISIVQSRSEQRNFQLIIITHDEDFIELLGRSETVEHFYKVSKDNNAHSKITKLCISKLN